MKPDMDLCRAILLDLEADQYFRRPSDGRLQAMVGQINAAWEHDTERFAELKDATDWMASADQERLLTMVMTNRSTE